MSFSIQTKKFLVFFRCRISFFLKKNYHSLTLKPCYNFTTHKIEILDLIYHFSSGITMVVLGKRYFKFDSGISCFPVDPKDAENLEFTPGPSIILGNYMQVNQYIEYDLKN